MVASFFQLGIQFVMSTHDQAYFMHCRKEVLPLLPRQFKRLLEVGCGSGHTAKVIREIHQPEWMGGIELDPQAVVQARMHFDDTWQLDIEQAELPVEPASVDVILCLDVLEHLVDPWGTVDRLAGLLKPGGCLITSIPNIRHYKVLSALLFRGEFEYCDAGILDRTHLRFFVRGTAIELMSRADLIVDHVSMTGIKRRTPKWVLNKLLLGGLSDILALQYLIRSVKES